MSDPADYLSDDDDDNNIFISHFCKGNVYTMPSRPMGGIYKEFQ